MSTAAHVLHERGDLSEVDFVSAVATDRIAGLKLPTLRQLMDTVSRRVRQNVPEPTDCILTSGMHLSIDEYETLEAHCKRVESTYSYKAPQVRRRS